MNRKAHKLYLLEHLHELYAVQILGIRFWGNSFFHPKKCPSAPRAIRINNHYLLSFVWKCQKNLSAIAKEIQKNYVSQKYFAYLFDVGAGSEQAVNWVDDINLLFRPVPGQNIKKNPLNCCLTAQKEVAFEERFIFCKHSRYKWVSGNDMEWNFN